MATLMAFVLALTALIAVHEYGHYRVAVACGVKVLRFSIGLGPAVLRWRPKDSDTEFSLGALPIGGYVKMLDEREGPVDPAERHRAFGSQSLRARFAIVAAGPLANLLLAVLLYAAVGWTGTQEAQAILASPDAASVAARAGLQGGEWVQRGALEGQDLQDLRSYEDLRWLVTKGAMEATDVTLEVTAAGRGVPRQVQLRLSDLHATEVDLQLLRKIGLTGPWTRPVIGELQAGGAAQRAGLQPEDLVLRVGETRIADAQQLRTLIRSLVREGQPLTQTWEVQRNGKLVSLQLTPELRQDGASTVAKIGAYVGSSPAWVTVRRGPVDGLRQGFVRTWDMSSMSLKLMGKMLIGDASLKNLSGPLTIADYAGKSASQGLTSYLQFLALISVSLGVLNLLPLPVLDGGHLMYYLWEGVTGAPVSDNWVDRLQKGGIVLLLAMMSIALFNDVTRLLG